MNCHEVWGGRSFDLLDQFWWQQ